MATMVLDLDGVMVTLVAWPADAVLAADLRAAGRPRVLMVEPSAPAPARFDELEDWIRLPGEARDIEIRAQRVARISLERRRRQAVPAGRSAP